MSFESLKSIRILGLTPPRNDLRNEVEQELDREIHDSEGRRAVILAVLFAALLAAYVWACAARPEIAHILPGPLQRVAVGLSLGVALLVVALIKPASVLLRRANRPPPLGGRLISAFIETSLPTAIMLSLSAFRGMATANALLLVPMVLYFPLIILSILRFDRRISIFTGLVAGAEYGVLSFWVLGDEASVTLLGGVEYLVNVGVLVLSGFLAGGAASRIRSWIQKSYAMSEARRRADEEQKRTLDRFGQHVSPAVASKLLDREFGSEIRQVCVMFLDIRDFTTFAEKLGPEQVLSYLNSVFGFMIEVVNAHNGIINKFLGDGFMAVFGAPFSDGQDCRNAIQAAREILAGLDVLVAKGAIPPTRVGIGLHTGPAVTGVIGTEARGEYAVIGDVVNLASRIESHNKQFGSCLLVTEDVLAAIGERPESAIEHGLVKVKGRNAPVRLFQLG